MAGTNRGTFFSGAGLVWKWQRLVWWIFAVCLIFGILLDAGNGGPRCGHAESQLGLAAAGEWIRSLGVHQRCNNCPTRRWRFKGRPSRIFQWCSWCSCFSRRAAFCLRTCLAKNPPQRLSSRPRPPFLAFFSPADLSRNSIDAHRRARRRHQRDCTRTFKEQSRFLPTPPTISSRPLPS